LLLVAGPASVAVEAPLAGLVSLAGALGNDTCCPRAFAAAVICRPRLASALADCPRERSALYLASNRFSAACCWAVEDAELLDWAVEPEALFAGWVADALCTALETAPAEAPEIVSDIVILAIWGRAP
jgi:hypothetical protein